MSGSAYASALGRLKSDFTSFLSKESFAQLLSSKDVGEIAKQLESTPYALELNRSRASYQGAALLEITINRTFVRRNHQAYETSPFAGKPVVGAFLRRWDIQNIELILSVKGQGRSLSETEEQLVSSRDIPASLFAGTMTLDDFRLLLQQQTLEGVASALVRFGYGQVLLPLLDAYERTHDIFPLLHALDREYYRQLFEACRYFQGDEWVVRQFVQSEVDVRNLLLLLKGKDAELPVDDVLSRFLEGGVVPKNVLQELYTARGVPELIEALTNRYPTLPEGNAGYAETRSLTGYEAALLGDRAVQELRRLKSYPLSLSVIFTYLLLAELERVDLRRIVFGKLYGISSAALSPHLITPRL